MCVQKLNAQCVLQFTPSIASRCVLPRTENRVILCQEWYGHFCLNFAKPLAPLRRWYAQASHSWRYLNGPFRGRGGIASKTQCLAPFFFEWLAYTSIHSPVYLWAFRDIHISKQHSTRIVLSFFHVWLGEKIPHFSNYSLFFWDCFTSWFIHKLRVTKSMTRHLATLESHKGHTISMSLTLCVSTFAEWG